MTPIIFMAGAFIYIGAIVYALCYVDEFTPRNYFDD